MTKRTKLAPKTDPTLREAYTLLAEAASRLPHGVAFKPGRACPPPTCFRCDINRFVRRRLSSGAARGDRR